MVRFLAKGLSSFGPEWWFLFVTARCVVYCSAMAFSHVYTKQICCIYIETETEPGTKSRFHYLCQTVGSRFWVITQNLDKNAQISHTLESCFGHWLVNFPVLKSRFEKWMYKTVPVFRLWLYSTFWKQNMKYNKTGLQPVSRPVERVHYLGG